MLFCYSNNIKTSTEELKGLSKKLSYVPIFQVTKDGKFKDSQEYQHDVDTSIVVKNMTAWTEKNRFGGSGKIQV